MRTHVEWLQDCHQLLLRAPEQFLEALSTPLDLDDWDAKNPPNVVVELWSLDEHLRFVEVPEVLECFAVAHDAEFDEPVDGKYASYHEALYEPIRQTVSKITKRWESDPSDGKGICEILKQSQIAYTQIAGVLEDSPGLWRSEFAAAINGAAGRYQPGEFGNDSFDALVESLPAGEQTANSLAVVTATREQAQSVLTPSNNDDAIAHSWNYLPRELCEEFGISTTTLSVAKLAASSPRTEANVNHLCSQSESHPQSTYWHRQIS